MSKIIRVRITFYWPTRAWGHKTTTGARSSNLKTCAIDPKVIRYGSTVSIPSLGWTMKAVDSGPAVVRKTASKGKAPIVDVFVSSAAEARRLNAKTPDYVLVTVSK